MADERTRAHDPLRIEVLKRMRDGDDLTLKIAAIKELEAIAEQRGRDKAAQTDADLREIEEP